MLESLLIPFALAFTLAVIATRVAIMIARRLAFLDQPGSEAHKQQTRAVPYGGGAGMAVAMGITLALVTLFSALHPDENAAGRGPWWPLFSGALGLFILGFIDDIRPLTARTKLTAQVIFAGVAVWFGDLGIDSLRSWPLLSYGVAWAWLVLVSNAYNLLDHDDGLCASIAVVSVLVLFSGAQFSGDGIFAQFCLILVGTLLGFLVWNRPPARVYMGDAGSLPLGFLIGAGTLSVTFWPSGETGSQLSVLAPLLITALPLFDTATVVIKRLRRHQPIMKGDRNHISHRLHRLGMSPKRRLLTAIAVQVALAAGAIQLRTEEFVTAAVVLAQAAAIFLVVVLLETSRDHHD
jgi:UDP-GlcNAc:undecaprenyl-phosphate/decaprenyl-phosphate GlcNAc-1-phosphate transferase